jgi:hypothetical protein
MRPWRGGVAALLGRVPSAQALLPSSKMGARTFAVVRLLRTARVAVEALHDQRVRAKRLFHDTQVGERLGHAVEVERRTTHCKTACSPHVLVVPNRQRLAHSANNSIQRKGNVPVADAMADALIEVHGASAARAAVGSTRESMLETSIGG